MEAGYQNLRLTKGRSFGFAVTYCQEDGEPVNIVGYKALLQVRRQPTRDSRLVLEFSTDNGRIQIPEPMKGELRIGINPRETEDLLEGDWHYDLILYAPTPKAIEMGGSEGNIGSEKTVVPLLTGRFSVKGMIAEVPRDPVELPEPEPEPELPDVPTTLPEE